MEVALIHHQYVKKGGLESDLLNLIDALSKQNDQVTLFTYLVAPDLFQNNCKIVRYKPCIPPPKMLRKFFFINFINRTFCPNDFDLSISLTRTAKQDIVICGGTHRGYLKKISNFLRYVNIKHILEIYYEKKAFSKSKAIIAHSQAIAEEIRTLYRVTHDKIHQIYPLIDNEKFVYIKDPAKKAALAEKFNLKRGKTTLLFPSTGHKRKGLTELLKAMVLLSKKDRDIELIVAGKPFKNRKKIPQNVRFLGFVDDMPNLYGTVDFTILPAHHEPFGLVVVESIQCGTPVIISKMVGAKELISRDEGVILESIAPQHIASVIQKIKKKKFRIKPNFIERNKLTLSDYLLNVKKLLITR